MRLNSSKIIGLSARAPQKARASAGLPTRRHAEQGRRADEGLHDACSRMSAGTVQSRTRAAQPVPMRQAALYSFSYNRFLYNASSTMIPASMSIPQTILELAPLLRQKEISPVELTQECLARIEKQNPALNAFITVTADSALAAARAAEAEITRGDWRGPLHGIPLSLKDLIDTAAVRTTAGSKRREDRIPTEDAE